MTALQVGEQLAAELARHNVPSYVYPLGERWVAVSVWRGLIARTNGGIIWWTAPHPSRRGHALVTYGLAPSSAAKRISGHYLLVRARDPEPSVYLDDLRPSESRGPRHARMIGGPA
ncbi:hypothetical protein [Microbispora sp. NPDC049125]|uniref:hypothetical protein n=1 Tax=Microbispora sp. NPDC049125 TaxID=3154929 RepID=UPI0034678D83